MFSLIKTLRDIFWILLNHSDNSKRSPSFVLVYLLHLFLDFLLQQQQQQTERSFIIVVFAILWGVCWEHFVLRWCPTTTNEKQKLVVKQTHASQRHITLSLSLGDALCKKSSLGLNGELISWVKFALECCVMFSICRCVCVWYNYIINGTASSSVCLNINVVVWRVVNFVIILFEKTIGRRPDRPTFTTTFCCVVLWEKYVARHKAADKYIKTSPTSQPSVHSAIMTTTTTVKTFICKDIHAYIPNIDDKIRRWNGGILSSSCRVVVCPSSSSWTVCVFSCCCCL